MKTISKEVVRKALPPREGCSHKYDNGLLLVAGGGQFYTGGPALSAMAGFRAGVDMVYVLSPKRAADIIAGFSPNLAVISLKGDWLDKEDLPCLSARAAAAKAVAGEKCALLIGGGLGRSEETKQTVVEFLKELKENKVKAVVDADGIYALSKSPETAKGLVLTPHAHEFFVLTGRQTAELSLEDKAKAVKEEARRMGSVILLKGKEDIVSNGKETAINTTGNPYMTVGGTGDVLAGILGALLAQSVEPFLAAKAAAFINGRAGDMAFKKFGAGLLATDLIDEIAQVIK